MSAEQETVKGEIILKLKLVVLLSGEPVTVIVESPVGVEADVEIVSALEQVGLQDVGENENDVPVKVLAEKLTGWVVPLVLVAVIVLVTD